MAFSFFGAYDAFMNWRWCNFSDLSIDDLYGLIRFREEIFVVEQKCAYLECDGYDPQAFHLLGYEGGKLAAYLRAFPAGVKYPEICFGRVAVGMRPYAVALAQGRGFVTDQYGGTVSVFDLATLKSVKRITVGDYPEGIAATADGRRIIVANWESNTVSVIDAVALKVVGEGKVGDGPRAFGAFLRRTE